MVLWLAGSAGRKQLTGILNFVKNGHPWTIRLITEPNGLTSEVLRNAERDGIDGLIVHAGQETARELSLSAIPTVLIDFPPPSLALRRDHIAILLDSDEDIGKCGAEYFLNLGNYASFGFIPDRDLRLGKVKNRLATTNMSIEKISRLCGYANTQRLKYVFKSRFGKSMSEWRKTVQRHGSSADFCNPHYVTTT